jgi:hypothetical protein
MAREPHYPEDAAVGGGSAKAGEGTSGEGKRGEAQASAAAAAAAKGKGGDSRRAKHLVTGAAIGIGSAAIVAALLYANRSRKS